MGITIDSRCICVIYDLIEKKSLATCFAFLQKKWFVTAKHVVVKDGAARQNLQLIFLNGTRRNCYVSHTHLTLDLALLIQIDETVCERPLMPGHHDLTNKEGLYCLGYKPSISIGTGFSKIEVNHIPQYEIEERERDKIEKLLHFEAPFSEGGNSGGPILGSGGAVIGVIIENYQNGDSYFCRATYIDTILDNIKFDDGWVKYKCIQAGT